MEKLYAMDLPLGSTPRERESHEALHAVTNDSQLIDDVRNIGMLVDPMSYSSTFNERVFKCLAKTDVLNNIMDDIAMRC